MSPHHQGDLIPRVKVLSTTLRTQTLLRVLAVVLLAFAALTSFSFTPDLSLQFGRK